MVGKGVLTSYMTSIHKWCVKFCSLHFFLCANKLTKPDNWNNDPIAMANIHLHSSCTKPFLSKCQNHPCMKACTLNTDLNYTNLTLSTVVAIYFFFSEEENNKTSFEWRTSSTRRSQDLWLFTWWRIGTWLVLFSWEPLNELASQTLGNALSSLGTRSGWILVEMSSPYAQTIGSAWEERRCLAKKRTEDRKIRHVQSGEIQVKVFFFCTILTNEQE